MNAAAAHASEPDQHYDLADLPDRPLTLADLERLPRELGHHFELQDGGLIVTPAPSTRHQLVSSRLMTKLDALTSNEWIVAFAPGFAPHEGRYREPDLVVCDAAAERMGMDYPRPEEILMMVEVVSPSTITTDRLIKPIEYASHGIPYYMVVELNSSGRVVKLYLHENIENPHREFESDPERVFHRIGETMTGGAPLPLPKPFTGALDPSGL
jgi:Uma2 family endonuclease